MKKRVLALAAFSVLSLTGLGRAEASDWHGYFGMGGEIEQGVSKSPTNNGEFGKFGITLAEFSLWNDKYEGYSIFGKVINFSM
ncbi:MAG: hypothetical protein ACRCU6_04265, partial [Fusobacteriaceae bacterium]